MSYKKRIMGGRGQSPYREYESTKLFSDLGIAPLILDVKPIGSYFDLTMQKYPKTFSEYVDNGGDLEKYRQRIDHLINNIHQHGVIHGDLHSDNIVLNPETEEVKIIDYGRSRYFREVTPAVIQELNKFLEPNKPFESLNDIVKFERIMYLRDF